MRIEVQSRSGKTLVPGGVNLDSQATVQDLQQAISRSGKGRLHPSRQRLTVPGAAGAKPTVLSGSKQLSEFALTDGSVVTLKDLGLQVGYSTLFFWEYIGPLVLYALVYFQPGIFYHHLKHTHQTRVGKLLPFQEAFPAKQTVQTLALAYWSFHFAKRIFETYYVHKFSHATVPVSSLVKNCAYYWAFAVFVAYFINHPLYTAPPLAQTYAAFAFAAVCQLANLRCHIIQSGLRPSGGTGYSIPRGFLFEYVTCANYCAEIYGWVAFTVGTQTVAPGIFILCGGAQMAIWAAGKHARLRKIYNGKDGKEKYPRRWVMLPPFY